MKNARQLKTIALNLLSDAVEAMNLTPNDVVAGNVELTDEDKTNVIELFNGYRSQIADRIESRADRSAKKLAARIKSQEARKSQLEKRQAAKAERAKAKDQRKAEREAAKEAKTKEKNGKANGRRTKAKAQAPELAPA